jgi:non-lysosomal glucosylceramidase
MHGMVEEGVEIVDAVRNRHNGARRNPFNDIECGSYYARSMSAWQLVNAWSGLHADFVDGTLAFTPAKKGDQTLFWSAGEAFGMLTIAGGKPKLEVLGGALPKVKVTVNGQTV